MCLALLHSENSSKPVNSKPPSPTGKAGGSERTKQQCTANIKRDVKNRKENTQNKHWQMVTADDERRSAPRGATTHLFTIVIIIVIFFFTFSLHFC